MQLLGIVAKAWVGQEQINQPSAGLGWSFSRCSQHWVWLKIQSTHHATTEQKQAPNCVHNFELDECKTIKKLCTKPALLGWFTQAKPVQCSVLGACELESEARHEPTQQKWCMITIIADSSQRKQTSCSLLTWTAVWFGSLANNNNNSNQGNRLLALLHLAAHAWKSQQDWHWHQLDAITTKPRIKSTEWTACFIFPPSEDDKQTLTHKWVSWNEHQFLARNGISF